MKFEIIKLSVSVVAMSLLTHVACADQESCLEVEIKKACDQLGSFKETDIIDLGNGRLIPACLSNAVRAGKIFKVDQQNEKSLKQYLEILAQNPPLEMSAEYREAIYRNWEEFIDVFGIDNSTISILWPPKSKNPQKTEVTRAELIKWFGEDRYKAFVAFKYKNKRGADVVFDEKHPEIVIKKVRPNEGLRLFNFSKSAVLDKLDIRSDNQITSDQQKDIKNRTEQISLEISENPSVEKMECKPFSIAVNDFNNSSVSMSDQRFVLSDVDSIRSMAHEVAHSHDSCRMLQYLVQNKTTSMMELFVRGTVNPKVETLIANPTSVQNYPFRNVISCLLSEEGGGFKESRFDQRIFDTNFNGPCIYGHHNEAFCDWVAAKAVAQYLSENKTISDPAYKISFSNQSENSRTVKFPSKLASSFTYIDRICEEQYDKQLGDSSHPSWKKRFMKIYAREPKIAESLGCGPANNPSCSNRSSSMQNQKVNVTNPVRVNSAE